MLNLSLTYVLSFSTYRCAEPAPNRNRVFAAPARAGEGLFANAEFARANKQNISSRQTVSEKPNNHEKIYIFGKKCIVSAFFLQLSAKKNNKDYIKTLDTEQNADYTIMDWVY